MGFHALVFALIAQAATGPQAAVRGVGPKSEPRAVAGGYLNPGKGKRGVASSRTHPKLVLVGTVASIYQLAEPRFMKCWGIDVHVVKVLSGVYREPTITFAIHSPARAGVELGESYTVEATWTDDGYAVKEGLWAKRVPVRRPEANGKSIKREDMHQGPSGLSAAGKPLQRKPPRR